MTLTHRERLKACLANNPALDRPPVALWRHFPVDDQDPETLAAATLDFQNHYDFDMVKVTPASSFSIKDWGADDVWEGHSEGTRRYTRRVIEKPQDWERLPLVSPASPHLARQLSCLRTIRSALSPETPLLQTIFSPLAQAKNLAGNELLIVHIRQFPEAVLKGLEIIAETTRRFVEACLEVGQDGIFYSIQHAQASLLTLNEFKTFSLPNDLTCLEPAKLLWCNLLHLHGLNVYFDLITQSFFPDPLFHIVNWHDRETAPDLAEALKNYRGAVCGGISQKTIVFGKRFEVRKEAMDALTQTTGRRFILGTGCVVPVIAPHGNIMATRKIVEIPG
jgi:uroporphyrinogen decarboxylase